MIKIISEYIEFVSLKDEWNRLHALTGSKLLWLKHEWLDCWWQSFGSHAQLFVIADFGTSGLDAAVPLLIRPMKIKGFRQRVLRFIENGITPRSNFLFTEPSRERIAALWNKALESSGQWDLAILANIETGTKEYQAWSEYLVKSESRFVEIPERQSPYIDLSGGWDNVWNSFGKNLRRNLNRAKTRLSSEGEFHLIEFDSAVSIRPALEKCFEISRLSWKGEQGVDMAGSQQRRKFYDLITEEAIRDGWLRIWMLKLNDRYIAFEYALVNDGYVLPIAADYDPELKQCSPGAVLRSLILERLTSQSLDSYDFGGTLYDYKLYWTKQVRPHSQFWVFHSGIKSRMLYQMKARLLPAIERLKAKAGESGSPVSDE